MRPPAGVLVTGTERTFGDDEIIVSKTDTRGVITYANDVFCRVSAYDEAELVGRPHNVVRHPDMPRCLFKFLWNTLQAGSEMFVVVNNLAKDGANYWVLAHVTPTFGAGGAIVGYHSNRRAPRRGAIAEVAPLYEALLAEEKRHTSPTQAMAASMSMLEQALAARQQSYDEMVWEIVNRAEGEL